MIVPHDYNPAGLHFFYNIGNGDTPSVAGNSPLVASFICLELWISYFGCIIDMTLVVLVNFLLDGEYLVARVVLSHTP